MSDKKQASKKTGTRKSTSSSTSTKKKTSAQVKTTSKKTSTKKGNNSTVKKSSTPKKKNSSVNKAESSSKSTNYKAKKAVSKNTSISKQKEVKKEVVEEVKKEDSVHTKNNLLLKIKNAIKKISLSPKLLAIVGIICLAILLLDVIGLVVFRGIIDNKTTYYDNYNGVAIDGSNAVVVGVSDFKHSKLTSKNGNARGKIVKYDDKSNVIFEKIYKRGISTTFNSVITTSDGYIVAGTGIFSDKEKENEEREAILVKYDKKGKIVWEKFYQVLTNTSFTKVIAVSDGYIAIGQSIYANTELGNHTTGGGIIVKYDKNGNEIWHANHGGTKSGCFNDIVQVGTDYYVVGKDGADSGNIVKYNAKGEYQWHKNYSYTDAFGFSGVGYFNDGLYVVGSKKILPEGTGADDDHSTSNTDALLIKYDLNGEILFEKTFGGSSYEKYNDIVVLQNNLYVVGHLCSNDAGLKITTTDTEKMTGFIIKYDKNGSILKKEVYGGSNNDNLSEIVSDGISLYVVGYSNSKDGSITTSNDNGKDYFGKLIKLSSKLKKFYVK